MEAAIAADDTEAIIKCKRRSVRLTKEQNPEDIKLFRVMGIRVVEAPAETEA